MGNQTTSHQRADEDDAQKSPRSWGASVVWAAVIIGVTLFVSATVNPLFGRSVHWDWVAGIAPVGFVAIALSLRRRWI